LRGEAGQIDVVITGKQADAAILKQLEACSACSRRSARIRPSGW
ncbi:hypothetical protein Q6249_27915, partial [Klebsiella pneumoniae]|nr:hypothetical protein [Klebsiella pneumoniae]